MAQGPVLIQRRLSFQVCRFSLWRQSYLYHGNSNTCTGKIASLYWNGPNVDKVYLKVRQIPWNLNVIILNKFHHWLHEKFSKWQHLYVLVWPVMKIWSIWHFHFNVSAHHEAIKNNNITKQWQQQQQKTNTKNASTFFKEIYCGLLVHIWSTNVKA